MNDITSEQKKRVVTELSVLEKQLDQVLFRRTLDDEDDDSFPYLKTGAALAGGAGITAGGYYGGKKLISKGSLINRSTPQIVPLAGAQASAGVASTTQQVGERSFRVNPEIPERRFVLPGTTASLKPGQSKGFLGDLGTGAKAAAGEAKESLTSMWKRFVAGFRK